MRREEKRVTDSHRSENEVQQTRDRAIADALAGDIKPCPTANSAEAGLTYHLRVWRQEGPDAPGQLCPYTVSGVSPAMSLLEMLDLLNMQLVESGERPIEFDSDCREGICGMCGLVINGIPHGRAGVTTCMLRMRDFSPEETLTIEPFRAAAFPLLRDLVVDRSALDRLMAAGGYVSVNTGSAPPANTIPIGKDEAARALDAAACIGCGACVAACPNASPMLFVSAKIAQYTFLPQGRVEASRRSLAMLQAIDSEQFGHCSNYGECEAVCPAQEKLDNLGIARRQFWLGRLRG